MGYNFIMDKKKIFRCQRVTDLLLLSALIFQGVSKTQAPAKPIKQITAEKFSEIINKKASEVLLADSSIVLETNMTQKERAVCVRGITKQYGRSRKVNLVLDHLDMTVEKGTIYGLLGASGCGKTTLLTCIVGRRSITSGEIWVLGGKPGTRESGIPGPRLGYMPQEIALMRQFTVKDSLNHFGWIYGMKNEQIDEKTDFLCKLLDLPPLDTKIKNLSGGQQRRVSLAIALVHDPELMILDEPTVGLDPVLRQKIWDYLLDTVIKYERTIIITTHYIEEARQAHKIGLMRNGKLLAEDSPAHLLQFYNCTSLEDVFLRLSNNQERKIDEPFHLEALPDNTNLNESILLSNRNLPGSSSEDSPEKSTSEPPSIMGKSFEVHEFLAKSSPSQSSTNRFSLTRTGHAKALMTKNWYRITRHPGAIIFVFFFPMLELCSFYLSVGGRPQGLKLGVVNDELENFTSCQDYKNFLGDQYGGRSFFTDDGIPYCILEGLSCKFLEYIQDDLVIKVSYPDLESAMADAKKGKLIAVIHFLRNFSKEFETRLDFGGDTPNETIQNSQIPIWMDMSRRQSALILEKQLLDLHKEFLNKTFQECEIPPKVGYVPVRFYEPVFGNPDSDFSQFMTPGVVTTMIFFLAVSVTATIIVVERLDGIWDRTLLAGVSSTEILVSHIVLEAGVILLQTIEVIIFVFFIFRIPCVGSYFDIVILLMLQGFCGMCGGFLVSVSCNTVTASNFISMGSFYPILILSGLLWPIEGMPSFMRTLSVGMPTTLATLSMRNIMEKGWRLTRTYVYEGYLISIAWIIIFSTASILVVRVRK